MHSVDSKQVLYFGEPLLGQEDGLMRGGDLNASHALAEMQAQLRKAYPNTNLTPESEVHFIGAIGDDVNGTKISDEMGANNMKVQGHLVTIKKAPTALLIPYEAEDGRTKYRSSKSRANGASRHLYSDAAKIKEQVREVNIRPDIIGFSMITLSRPFAGKIDEFFKAIKSLKQKNPNAKVVFDSNYRTEIWNKTNDSSGPLEPKKQRENVPNIFKQGVEQSHLLSITDEDIKNLYQLDNEEPEAVLTALHQHIGSQILKEKEIILKRGEEPVYYWPKGTDKTISNATQIPIPLLSKEEIVDTEGAGDNFLGGTMAAYITGLPMEKSIEIGALTARKILQQKGGKLHPQSIPSIEEINNTISETELSQILNKQRQR